VRGSGCYPTIQAAVNASHNGDTIVIDPGTYRGGVRIATSLRIQGSGGRQAHRDGGRGQQPGFAPQDGRSNNGIVAVLKVSPSAVEKYVTNIFAQLDLPPPAPITAGS
jgi:hypothetical protein